MPTLAEKLSPNSSDAQVKAAISNSIQQLMNEGRDQQQAIAIAYSQARKATGKELGQGNPGPGKSDTMPDKNMMNDKNMMDKNRMMGKGGY